MVVLVIVALIVVIAIPSLRRSMIRADLLEEVNMVRQGLTVARMQAIKSGRRVAVELIPENSAQLGHTVVAWLDEGEDGALSPGDEVVGEWFMSVKTLIGPDITAPEWSLHALSGTARGIVFLPDGTAIAHANDIGIGFGSVVISDLKDNRIRLIITAGAGTVRQQMWNPDNSAWSDKIKYWRY